MSVYTHTPPSRPPWMGRLGLSDLCMLGFNMLASTWSSAGANDSARVDLACVTCATGRTARRACPYASGTHPNANIQHSVPMSFYKTEKPTSSNCNSNCVW